MERSLLQQTIHTTLRAVGAGREEVTVFKTSLRCFSTQVTQMASREHWADPPVLGKHRKLDGIFPEENISAVHCKPRTEHAATLPH